ncbi:MAG: hypothetical protein HY002_10475 [Candidatus Rokubacteria bacterium]|nr:hypothetical protein [Candidatus Rokubacteria bacterium]
MADLAAARVGAAAPGIKAKLSRDDWIMRAFMVLVGLYVVVTLALPLWIMLSKSLQNHEGKFIGLAKPLRQRDAPGYSDSLRRGRSPLVRHDLGASRT